ncbi:OmpA family protein [Pseudoxanthomonas sp.]|uniref:OmpA family protein n=1 Tax=Pseudoxanthomonas sp. TaxID=1871049 RepID=UPI002E0FDB2B|nr:OmpA family protein [Pseudoxanthomonas sp.]
MDVKTRGPAAGWSVYACGVALAWALTGTAAAQPASPARSVLGPWVGTYVCAQGLTGLTLSITEATPTRASALFHFYADRRNPRVPTGCFTMDGTYDPASGRLQLKGKEWLLKASGYRVVHFDGHVDAEGRSFTGKVSGGTSCKQFDLGRTAPPATPPAACAVAMPTIQPDLHDAGRIGDALAGDGRVDLNILFDFARATLRPDSLPQLDELGRVLQTPALAARRIGIHGHTDAVGEADANLRLSRQRAATVAEYLGRTFGIAASRLDVQGFGESRLKRPDAPDADANRRVAVVLLD